MKRPAIWGVAIAVGVSAAPNGAAQCEPVWSGLNGGASWEVSDLAVFDEDGPGPLPPALFAGGGFSRFAGIDSFMIARWDGWSAFTVGEPLTASYHGIAHLYPLEESTGLLQRGLCVGGEIESAGGLPVNNLVRWSGDGWHDVGGGVARPAGLISIVFSMQVFDEDGEGPALPALFVGGQFESAGGVPAEGLARWDGERWSEVGGGLRTATWPHTQAKVRAMTVYDDGRGPALYVAGSFHSAGGKEAWNIARWDGVEWEPVGPGLSTTVESLCVFDEDGPGPKRPVLFAGGQFSAPVGGTHGDLMRIARWDGNAWTAVGSWQSAGAVLAMTVWDEDGPGPRKESLYIGGFFNVMPDGSPANQLARWDGKNWHTVGGGVQAISGIGPTVRSLGVFDEDGPGPNPGGLYVGGLFSHAGGVPANNIARWGCPLPPTPPCYADCDGSGDLTFFDFLCFQNLFAALDPGADCDGDTAHTFFDFLCFQNAFAAGCP